MFQIQLGTNLSSMNVVDKEFSIINTVNGTLRAPSSIIDPVITCICDNNNAWRARCNYAYIPEFNRYYYVTNIVAVDGVLDTQSSFPEPHQLWEFHMHVDVLMSFKDQIRAQSAVVARQEEKYNLMLDDGFFMTYQNPKLQTKLFSVPDPFETQEFVLVVAGS